jgi:hypothetical protein
MRRLHKLGALIVTLGCATAAAAAGCSSNNNNSSSSSGDGGTTLYQRLGGHAGIRSAVNAIVGKELQDPEIASYFVYQTESPTPSGHPNVDQLEECLTDQLASAAGGTETYPTTVTDDAGSWTCRSMSAVHAQFDISGGTFSKFVVIAAAELQTLGVDSTDIATIGTVLNSTESAIVNPSLEDAGEAPFAPVDAGGDAATTLYQRLGEASGIRTAVNAIVAAELQDPDIASYFFNQTASPVPAGHPTADQLEACLADQLEAAAGGPQTYPVTVTDDAGSFACVGDMATIHQQFHISGGTFTKFVMIAGTVLTSANVNSTDIDTVASVLNGQQSAIVDPNLADAGEQPYDAASP